MRKHIRGFQLGSTKVEMHSHKTWLTAFDCENKGADLLRGAVKLTCAFVFAYTKYGFSFDAAYVDIDIDIDIEILFFVE